MSQSKVELPAKSSRLSRWECNHCSIKTTSLKEYSTHLLSAKHRAVMWGLSSNYREQITRMRISQRKTQRQVDKTAEESTSSGTSTRQRFCEVCKLNYRQLKGKHETSKAHYDMKRFLIRGCRICCLTFRNPMAYEAHICSLQHQKRKSYVQKRRNASSNGKTVDDNVEDEWVRYYDDDEDSIKDSSDKENRGEDDVNVGDEYVKKMEIYYCELCRTYCPKKGELETAVKKHCATRIHMLKYRRHREDVALKREAERIYKKNKMAKESEDNKKDLKPDHESSERVLNSKDINVSTNENSTLQLNEKSVETDESKADELLLFAEFDKELGESSTDEDELSKTVINRKENEEEQISNVILSQDESESENIIQQEEAAKETKEEDDK